ncbi:MAG: AAA family ATPase, partial [Pseudonocardia sp.]
MGAGLVGREAERARAERLVAEVGTGVPRALAVRGEPGIGKSALLGHLAVVAGSAGFLVLSGRAAEYEQDLPFGAVVDAVDPFLGAWDGAAPAELAAVFPALGPGTAPSPVDRHRLHRAMADLLAILAARRPVLLVLDDLHWADAATVELVERLLRRPPPGPVLLAAALRSGSAATPLRAVLRAAERHGHVEAVDLGPLDACEADLLLDTVLPPGAPQRDRIAADAGGNPFYLLQLARAPGAPAGEGDNGQLPAPIVAALRAELRDLPRNAGLLLAAAAVAGDPFEIDVAAAAAGLAPDPALDALDELWARDLVRTTDAPRRFAFRHPVLRRAAYAAAGSGWRIGAHARAAAALAAAGGPAAMRAHHVERSAAAGDRDAVAVLSAAARDVAGVAPVTAARWSGAALRLLPATAAAERVELSEATAASLLAAGRLDQARPVLRAAVPLAADEATRVRLACGCADVEWRLGARAEGLRLLTDVLGRCTDPALAVRVRIALGTAHLWGADPSAAARWAVEARDTARDPGLRATAAALLAIATAHDDLDAARLAVAEAAAFLDRFPDTDAAHVDAFLFAGWAETSLECEAAAVGHLQRALAVAADAGRALVVPEIRYGLAVALAATGDVAGAARAADEAAEAARATGATDTLAWARLAHLHAALAAGDAATLARYAREAGPERDPSDLSASIDGAGRAMVEMAGGDAAAGVTLMLTAGGGPDLLQFARAYRPYWYLLLTDAELRRGRRGAAAGWAERART